MISAITRTESVLPLEPSAMPWAQFEDLNPTRFRAIVKHTPATRAESHHEEHEGNEECSSVH